MIKGKWFITRHAVKKFAEMAQITHAEAFDRLVVISAEAKFIKRLPSGVSMYRFWYKPIGSNQYRKVQGLAKKKRNNIGLLVADPKKEAQLPALVTVLWENPYAKREAPLKLEDDQTTQS